jgi:phosphatidylserine/phosphatidylglycerophosphate/cardiolipin synthase-like enzyme
VTPVEIREQLVVALRLDLVGPEPGSPLADEVLPQSPSRWYVTGQRLPTVYHDPRSLAPEQGKRSSLHARCVVVDRQTALVSSANFTEAAHLRNIEVGTLVHGAGFAARLVEHFEMLADAKLLLPLLLGAQEQPR